MYLETEILALKARYPVSKMCVLASEQLVFVVGSLIRGNGTVGLYMYLHTYYIPTKEAILHP